MRQILVTLDESTSLQAIRHAISMLRGVTATSVYKEKEEEPTPTRAYQELKATEAEGRPLQSVDDFIREMEEMR